MAYGLHICNSLFHSLAKECARDNENEVLVHKEKMPSQIKSESSDRQSFVKI